MNLEERIQYRSSLPKQSIFDFSSSSDSEPELEKHCKILEPGIEASSQVSSASGSPSYRATQRSEIHSLTPKLLSNLGYLNRNVRPPFSRKNEIIPSSSTDSAKVDYSSILLSQQHKEQKKLENFKAMLQNP